MFGLRPWLAFLRRTEAFFLEVRFDMADDATGAEVADSRRARSGLQRCSSSASSLVVVDQLRRHQLVLGVPTIRLMRLWARAR